MGIGPAWGPERAQVREPPELAYPMCRNNNAVHAHAITDRTLASMRAIFDRQWGASSCPTLPFGSFPCRLLPCSPGQASPSHPARHRPAVPCRALPCVARRCHALPCLFCPYMHASCAAALPSPAYGAAEPAPACGASAPGAGIPTPPHPPRPDGCKSRRGRPPSPRGRRGRGGPFRCQQGASGTRRPT
jgi:hypothetical protein